MELVEWYDLDTYFQIRYSLFYLTKLRLVAFKNDVNHGQSLNKNYLLVKLCQLFFVQSNNNSNENSLQTISL